jgi:hypothetical protein
VARKPTPSKKTAETTVLPRNLVVGVQTGTPATGLQPGATISNPNLSYYNKSISDLRSERDIFKAVRTLVRISGDAGAAVATTIRLANTNLRFQVYTADHQLDDVGQAVLKSLLAKYDNLSDYTLGYDDRMALAQLKEVLLRDVLLAGACSAELVLDKTRMPYQIKPVNPTTLKWKIGKTAVGKNAQKIIPVQIVQGQQIELDVATFFYASLDQDSLIQQAQSPLESALNTSIAHAELMEDIRRVVRRSGHSRLMVKLDVEKLRGAAPPDIQADPKKLAEWMDTVRTNIKTELESLSPEAALVFYDTVETDYLNSQIGSSADYTSLLDASDGAQATSLRTPPTVLGKRMSSGSQNVSSTESLLFVKTAAGIQPAVETVLSRAMTLAVRLIGYDGYVKAKFDDIDLRPGTELEAFHQMKQARVLEQLSLGFLTDAEAAEALGTGVRAPGAPPLSGTMFYAGQTKNTDTPSPNGDPARRALAGNATPNKSGGRSQ